MSCVDPEVLSRWVDGTLGRAEARAAGRHVLLCAACRAKADELRAAGEWLLRATEPGRGCLSAEEIAAVLEGAEAPAHAAACPRCAAEIAALKPRKRATRRISIRRESTGTAWFAAAAAVTLAVLGLVFLAQQQRPVKDVVVAPAEPEPVRLPEEPPVRPQAPIEIPRPLDLPDPVRPRPAVPVPAPKPSDPAPEKVEPPAPKPPAPAPAPSPRPTIVEPPAKRVLALSVKTGAISTLADGKWIRAARVEEGMPLRTEGRTSIEFAKARLTLDGASRFTLAADEVALADGAISFEAHPGSGLSLLLGPCRIVPMASAGRVLLAAKPDRVVVEEGAARWQEIVLHQGVEHQLKGDKLEPQKRRTLPAAARSREASVWRPDFKDAAVRSRMRGRVDTLAEGIQVTSVPMENKAYFESTFGFTAVDERGFLATRPGTALRFRYFLSEPALLQLVVYNGTKRENFNLDLDPVAGKWTTVTVLFRDVPVNQGGDRTLKWEAGDRVWSFGCFVGKPGSTATLTVDQVEIVEVER